MSSVLILFRLVPFGLAIVLLSMLQWLVLRLAPSRAGPLPVAVSRLFLRALRVRVTVSGTPPRRGDATLVLANHTSYIDIFAIGSLVPLSFIAKQEIAGWPMFGTLTRLQRGIFLDRTRRGATAEVNAVVAERLSAGDVIVLFPEGTTGDGNRVLPFRSSLVGAVRAAVSGAAAPAIALQPLAVAYRRRNGLPVGRRDRPEIAWYGDMDLMPHLSTLLRGGPLDVALHWCDPIPFDAGTNRKHATADAERAIREALRAA